MQFGRKIRLCLNANLTDPDIVRYLSAKFNVTTASQRATDKEVFIQANKDDRHIITRNTKHYRPIFRSLQNVRIGVIGVNTEKIDLLLPKLNWLLTKEIRNHQALYEKFYEIDLEGYEVIDKKGNTVKLKTKWP